MSAWLKFRAVDPDELVHDRRDAHAALPVALLSSVCTKRARLVTIGSCSLSMLPSTRGTRWAKVSRGAAATDPEDQVADEEGDGLACAVGELAAVVGEAGLRWASRTSGRRSGRRSTPVSWSVSAGNGGHHFSLQAAGTSGVGLVVPTGRCPSPGRMTHFAWGEVLCARQASGELVEREAPHLDVEVARGESGPEPLQGGLLVGQRRVQSGEAGERELPASEEPGRQRGPSAPAMLPMLTMRAPRGA